MAANEIVLELQEGGILRFPGPMLKKYDLKKGSRIIIVPKTDTFFWIETENPGKKLHLKGKGGDIALCGDLAMFGIADLLSLINMGQKTGALCIESKGIMKTAFFKGGDVVFGASTDPEDRIGNVLYKTGKISKEKLAEAEGLMSKGTRFGEVLLSHGFLSEKDLAWAVKYQIEEIIYSIFAIKEGFFYFVEGELVDDDLDQFSLNTQNVLMEGFRRVDEMGLIRGQIASLDVVLSLQEQALAGKKLSPAVQKILQFIDGRNSVRDIIRLSGVGEFNIFKLFYELMKMGIVAVKEGDGSTDSSNDGDPLDRLVNDYNRIFAYVYGFLKAREAELDVQAAFNAFFESVSPNLRQLFARVSINDNGLIDKGSLLKNFREMNVLKGGMFANIAGLGDLMSGQLLSEGLNELLNFELFTAKKLLPKEEADRLILKVREAQAKIQKASDIK